jgi:hypothetical protein
MATRLTPESVATHLDVLSCSQRPPPPS